MARSEQTRSAREIFEDALDIASAEERAAYVKGACVEDDALLQRVEELLRANDVADSFLPNEPQASSAVASIEEKPGTVIGRYKLLQKIGEGGMGVVYMAEQEEPVRRKVALKIIKLGMDTRQVVARFEAERQALAMMDHPHIAKVLDAGATETGRPYFVMELVQGVPITEFCDKNHLSAEERIKLFIPVCQAIQSAHQKGIIHRDIKPSNVLVTLHNSEPMPKVIDFGVAKATNQKLTEKTLFTNFGTMIGTPAYMSPEQAEMSGLDIDTRSDIYGLGVLLYELLTGSTPFLEKRLRSVAYREMQRIIIEEEPERPSTRLTKTLAASRASASEGSAFRVPHSAIDPDLDWIVMKCLEKERARRYETASGLAVDIQRHLSNEPVVARPPSAAYRCRKLVRRHQAASLASLAVALAVMLGGTMAIWSLVRERAARRQANERLRSALVFVNEMFNGVAPEIEHVAGASKAREQLGDAGLKFVNQLRTDAAENPELRVVLARVLVYLSEAQGAIGAANTVGNYEAGLQRAEQAIDLLSIATPRLGEGERLQLLIRAHYMRTECLWGMGRFEEVVARLERLDPLLEQLERFPDFEKWARAKRLDVTGNAGHTTALAGRPREAIDRYLQPVLKSKLELGITTNSSEWKLENLATTYGQLVGAYGLLKEFEPVIQNADEGLRICEVLINRFPNNVRHRAFRAAFGSARGHALVRVGRTNEGLSALGAGRNEIEELAAKDAANAFLRRWRGDIAATQARAFAALSGNDSVTLSERRDRLAQAERYLAQADEYFKILKAPERGLIWSAAHTEVAAAGAKFTNSGSQPEP